jgi:hypothetical protein
VGDKESAFLEDFPNVGELFGAKDGHFLPEPLLTVSHEAGIVWVFASGVVIAHFDSIAVFLDG